MSLADAGGRYSEFYDAVSTTEFELYAIFNKIATTVQPIKTGSINPTVISSSASVHDIEVMVTETPKDKTQLGVKSNTKEPTDENSSKSVDSLKSIDKMWKLLDEVQKSLKVEMICDDNLTNIKPNSIKELYKNLARLEAALSPSARTSEWATDKRRQWQQEVNKTSKYCPAHFTSCLFTFEEELRAKSQEPMWMKLHRGNWIDSCEQLGADRLDLRKQRPERASFKSPQSSTTTAASQHYHSYKIKPQSTDELQRKLMECTKTTPLCRG